MLLSRLPLRSAVGTAPSGRAFAAISPTTWRSGGLRRRPSLRHPAGTTQLGRGAGCSVMVVRAFAAGGSLGALAATVRLRRRADVGRGARAQLARWQHHAQLRHFGGGPPMPDLPEALGMLGGVMGTAAKLYGALLLVVFFMQRKLIFLPSSSVADLGSQGGEKQVISLLGPGEEQRVAVFFPPPSPERPVLVADCATGRTSGRFRQGLPM
eukprot:TRINITY_DN9275_c0_g1_i2.p1 TRINITY_DN9275_c0_g1~~TRINITY_DN9275_c0_g1_i2.p1  ORF type:complete len:235 (-),score=29.80 TRINITY_DN9275_c0_g1_i2:98-730(-)